MIKKIVEWDKKRKFGHKFEDFILIFCVYVVINLLVFFALKEINLYVTSITAVVSVLLWSRNPPCD